MTKRSRQMDGYVRVSRVGGREGDSFISPQQQRERIEAAAKNAGAEIVTWHTDLDESGGKWERPGFQAALERVESGVTDGVVVAKLDRFARSVLDAREAIRRIEQAGGSLVSAEDGFDSKTPMGRFAVTMLFGLAELELERVRENWTAARTFAARRGVHMAKPLTGYDRGDDGRLVSNEGAPAIAEAFRRRAQGANWSELARFLDEREVRPYGRAEGGKWTSASVRALLRNRGYLGEIRAGSVVNAEAHVPLVTFAEFEAAQAASGRPIARSSEPRHLLTGLLRCASCRHTLKPKTITGTGAKVYRCMRDHGGGVCPSPATIYASVVEPYVERLLLTEVASRAYRPEAETRAIEEAEREVANTEAELSAWVTDEAIVAIGRDVYVEGLQARQRRLDEAQARRRSLFADTASALPSRTELRELWPALTNAERRRLLASALDVIIVRPNGRRPVDERIVVLLHGEAPGDLPGRGKRVPFKGFDLPEDAGMPLAQDRDHASVEGSKRRRSQESVAV